MDKKSSLAILVLFITLSASAQLKVSSTGKVSVGTTSASSSALSVNSTGHSDYAAFINGACKVDSGYVNGTLFSPSVYPGNQSTNLLSAVENLLQLTPVKYTPALSLLSPSDSSSEEMEQDEDGTRYPGLEVHYAIPGYNMRQYYASLVKKDENNQYIINYVELIPLLVAAYQEVVSVILTLHPELTSAFLPDDAAPEEEMQEMPQNRPQIALQRFSDARLFQNNPNPFTAQTEIRFRIPQDAKSAFVYIFDMTGKMLKQIPVSPDDTSVTVQGYELSPGIYLYSLSVDGQEIDTKRMILSK